MMDRPPQGTRQKPTSKRGDFATLTHFRLALLDKHAKGVPPERVTMTFTPFLAASFGPASEARRPRTRALAERVD